MRLGIFINLLNKLVTTFEPIPP